MSVLQDITKLNAGTLMIFYALDLSPCIGKFGQTTTEKFLWCDGVNELGSDVVWSGALPGITGYNTVAARTYTRYPIQSSGFDRTGDGTIPRPKLAIANTSGIIGALARDYNDLIGAKLVRVRTFLKYIDGINFSKLNLFLNSNDITKTGFGNSTDATRSAGNVVTITNVTNPYVYQTPGGFSSVKGKTFHFSVEASTTTAIGKYLRLYIYTNTPSEVYSTIVGPLTSTPTRYSASYTFATSTATTIIFRVDMDAYKSQTWSVGNTVVLSKWQANEGKTLNTYIETTSSRNPNADPLQYLDREIWTIDRKSTENSAIMEWELTAPYDLVGVKLPKRQCIQNACVWKYKSAECGYTGTNYFDKNDIAVASAAQDVCAKRLSSCKARFGSTAILPFGGFPSVGLN